MTRAKLDVQIGRYYGEPPYVSNDFSDEWMRAVIKTFPHPRERLLLLDLLEDGCPGISARAREWGISPSRVFQVRERGIRKLRVKCKWGTV